MFFSAISRLVDDRRAVLMHVLVAVAMVVVLWQGATAAGAMPAEPEPDLVVPSQQSEWESVLLEGATCGRGEPFKYYISASDSPGAGIFFLLNGGGVCMKDGKAPPGASGPARQLYCMDFTNFVDVLANDTAVAGLPLLVRYFRRWEADNPFKDYTYVLVPYCTGDVHAGSLSEPYDYDPDPDATFEVIHRGRLNLLAVLDDVKLRVPGDVPVVLTGMSAGGFGAILNYPEFDQRWPRTVLIPDAGIAPPHPDSLMAREGARMAERWGSRGVLPDYCATDDCLSDTLRLLVAHANHHDGADAPWRPFGLMQGQQDGTLSSYLEIGRCSYQMGLRTGLNSGKAANLRAYVPATADHVFGATPNYATPVLGVDMFDWFSAVVAAEDPGDLPADAVDPWMDCNPLSLPALNLGR